MGLVSVSSQTLGQSEASWAPVSLTTVLAAHVALPASLASDGSVPRSRSQPQHGHRSPLPPPAAGDGCGQSGGPGSGASGDTGGWRTDL